MGRDIQKAGFKGPGSKHGFTMVELLVVLAIIVVVTTISIPTIESMTSPKNALRKEGRKVMQLMAEARTAAIARKVKVDVRVDPETREVRMIEAQAYRSILLETGQEESTNRYEKTVMLDEEFELDAFSADQIQNVGNEDPFQKTTGIYSASQDEPEEMLAVSFSHFGGSNGGGISLIREGVRLDIAADILTGRPKVVKRETPDE